MTKQIIFFFFVAFSLAVAAVESPEFPGGPGGTVDDSGFKGFSHPFPGASRERKREFFVGNSFFRDAWVEAPSSTSSRDGLGPTYNAVACASCHFQDGRGIGLTAAGEIDISLLFRLSESAGNPHAAYGDQLNPIGIGAVPGEGRALVTFTSVRGTYPDGSEYSLRQPHYTLTDLKFGPFTGQLSPRVAPQIPGLGLLEAISAEDVVASADPGDQNQDGISGKANWVRDIRNNKISLGRFGWKAGQPTLEQQNAAAFLGDIGITSELFPMPNCPSPQGECAGAISGGDPEVDPKILTRVTLYTQLIAVPKRRDFGDPEVVKGEEIFHRVNCQSCHRPSYVTGTHDLAELSGQKIYPYTDLLLHDMGEGLADGRPEGEASGREWRTPPLWGIGLIPRVNRHTHLLHDGRARSVEEAILWHGGEAESAKKAFMALPAGDRGALLRFVNSL